MIRQENLFPFLAGAVLLIVPIGIAVRGADLPDLHGNIVDFWVEAEVKSNIEPRHSPLWRSMITEGSTWARAARKYTKCG